MGDVRADQVLSGIGSIIRRSGRISLASQGGEAAPHVLDITEAIIHEARALRVELLVCMIFGP